MDRLLVTRQRVDAAHRSPDIVSRLGASVEGSHPPKRAPSFAYKALSRSPPLRWSIFSLTPSLCALLRFSSYSPMWIGEIDFDGFHLLSTDCPQLSPHIHLGIGLSVLETSNILRCLIARLCCSLQSVCDGCARVDECPSVSGGSPLSPYRPLARPSSRKRNL